MLFDCHCHLHFPQHDEDRQYILEGLPPKDMYLINSTVKPEETGSGAGLSKNPRVYWTLGLAASTTEGKLVEETLSLVEKYRDDIVGIGEVGIDYYWVKDKAGQEIMESNFKRFIEKSLDLKLPLVVHSRDAEDKCIELLTEYGTPALMHCFSGTPKQALKAVELDCIISLPTSISYSKPKQKLAGEISIDNLVLESDSPYLPPKPGTRNTPFNIAESLEVLAKIKDQSQADVASATSANARKFFNIK